MKKLTIIEVAKNFPMLYELRNEKQFFINNLEDIGMIDLYNMEYEPVFCDQEKYLESTRLMED